MSNTEILIEDLTDESYECGTDQVKYWLVSNFDHTGLSEQQTKRLTIMQLKDVFINTSLGVIVVKIARTFYRIQF
jgi:hypothetical protein